MSISFEVFFHKSEKIHTSTFQVKISVCIKDFFKMRWKSNQDITPATTFPKNLEMQCSQTVTSLSVTWPLYHKSSKIIFKDSI